MVGTTPEGIGHHILLGVKMTVNARINVTGPTKTGYICTNYTCSENGSFLGHGSHSANFIYFLIDLLMWHESFSNLLQVL